MRYLKVLFVMICFFSLITVSCSSESIIDNNMEKISDTNFSEPIQTPEPNKLGMFDKYHNFFIGGVQNALTEDSKRFFIDFYCDGDKLTAFYLNNGGLKYPSNETVGVTKKFQTIEYNGESFKLLLIENDELVGILEGFPSEHGGIEGTYTSLIDNKSDRLVLGHLYADGHNNTDQRHDYIMAVLDGFVNDMITYIVRGDREELSKYIHYPIEVYFDDEYRKIHNSDEFVVNFNKIFHDDFLKELMNAYTVFMPDGWSGIVFMDRYYKIQIDDSQMNDDFLIYDIQNY